MEVRKRKEEEKEGKEEEGRGKKERREEKRIGSLNTIQSILPPTLSYLYFLLSTSSMFWRPTLLFSSETNLF